MQASEPLAIRTLTATDGATLRGMLALFATAFDDPAVALYTRMGSREDVMHFDIPVAG